MTGTADKLALECRGVSFAYPDRVLALDDVSLAAAPGEFVAVVGSNGSGKTTLMKVLTRLLRPAAGQVLLGGADVATLRDAELYARVGIVFQNPADQLFAATVEQDVSFGPRNLGVSPEESADRARAALAAVGAQALATRPVHHLSFGEQKRVCLAGVLAMQPRVLVLDEPTAGLDPAGEQQMLELLLRLNRENGITMVLSTHSVDLLPALADRICVLSRGRVLRQGRPDEIFADAATAAEAGLRLPQIAQLFERLGDDGLRATAMPLTLEQARQQVLAWVKSATGDGPVA